MKISNTNHTDETPSPFIFLTPDESKQLDERQVRGSSMKPQTKALLEAFDQLKPGGAFLIVVAKDAKQDAKKQRQNTKSTLDRNKCSGFTVRLVDKEGTQCVMVQKKAEN